MRRLFLAGVVVIVVASLVPLSAQFGRGRWRITPADPQTMDGSWQLCRLAYQGRSWTTDYPDADYNFSTRLSELTRTRISRQPSGDPRPLIVRPTDDALFRCPFVMLWQAESLWFDEEDAARLREYLLKGGFIWADDSWGTFALQNFEAEMAKVLSPSEFPVVDVPLDHPMFRMLHQVKGVPQIPSINFWIGTGGMTSERGPDSAQVNVKGIFDTKGRLMVLNTHNTDVADGWEREGVDIHYFRQFSVDAYAVGINVALYTMLN